MKDMKKKINQYLLTICAIFVAVVGMVFWHLMDRFRWFKHIFIIETYASIAAAWNTSIPRHSSISEIVLNEKFTLPERILLTY